MCVTISYGWFIGPATWARASSFPSSWQIISIWSHITLLYWVIHTFVRLNYGDKTNSTAFFAFDTWGIVWRNVLRNNVCLRREQSYVVRKSDQRIGLIFWLNRFKNDLQKKMKFYGTNSSDVTCIHYKAHHGHQQKWGRNRKSSKLTYIWLALSTSHTQQNRLLFIFYVWHADM